MGGVPRMATELQLKAFAEKVGPVHSVTLVREPNSGGQNRGWVVAVLPVTTCPQSPAYYFLNQLANHIAAISSRFTVCLGAAQAGLHLPSA